MVKKTIRVTNATGVHARPSSLIVSKATKFKSHVTIETANLKAEAKSIMSLLMLGAVYDTELTITAVGVDEEEAVKAITEVFASNFSEAF